MAAANALAAALPVREDSYIAFFDPSSQTPSTEAAE
jgi:hypothetical protein